GDGLAKSVNIRLLVIAEQIVPKRHRVLGVAFLVGQKSIDEACSFVWLLIVDKLIELFNSWQKSDDIQVSSASEGGIVDYRRRRELGPGPIGRDEAVDGRSSSGRRIGRLGERC